MTRFGFLTSIATVIALAFQSQASAQVGKESGLWEWTPLAPHHSAIVEIHSGGGSGTGVVIEVDKSKKIGDGYEGYVLTAWHVIQDDIEVSKSKIKVKYRDHKTGAKGCRVVEYDESKDVALLWVWVPEDIEAVPMATEPIKGGDQLEFAGLGGGSKLDCIRHFSATASSPSSLEKIFADVPLLPGDSGGPVFNQNHEVVGIISGGWFWWNSGLTTQDGNRTIRTTWPARASNVGPLQTLVAKRREVEGTQTQTQKY